jgi:Flp pilus assembly protein TadB
MAAPRYARIVVAESWWARQRANADRDMLANRDRIRRRLEGKKRNPSGFTLLLRERRSVTAFVALVSLVVYYFLGGIWLVVAIAITFPFVMLLGSRYRGRLRREGWDI